MSDPIVKEFPYMSGEQVPPLSKSRILAGLQCPLRLWYQVRRPELVSPISASQQAVLDTGREVGSLATRLYPGGVYVETDPWHYEEAVRRTLQIMKNPEVKALYEGAFLYQKVRVRVDILNRLADGKWNLSEVKSSTRVKEEYRLDVGIQYHVLKETGVDIERITLMHRTDVSLKENTLRAYMAVLACFSKDFGERNLNEMTSEEIFKIRDIS